MNENVLPTDLTNNIINAARSFEISLAILNNFFSALDINDFFFFFPMSLLVNQKLSLVTKETLKQTYLKLT